MSKPVSSLEASCAYCYAAAGFEGTPCKALGGLEGTRAGLGSLPCRDGFDDLRGFANFAQRDEDLDP